MTDELRGRVSRAVAWVGLASAIVGVLDAVALIVLLAFWVTPTELGIATLATTLFYFLDLATEAGLSSVLVQRDTLDDATISTVFWLNLLVSVVVFAALFVLAPLVGALHGQPVAGAMLLAYGSKLLYQNVYFVPAALLRRELRFKELSIIRTVANFADVATKLVVAAAGEPIWCFVAGPLARVFVTGVGMQLAHPWRPRLVLRLAGARQWFSFGYTTTATWYLLHLYTQGTFQIVGYFFGETTLGIYRVANEVVLYPVAWVANVVSQVAFPAFARLRGAPAQLAAQFLRFNRQSLATIMPMLVLVLVAADDLLVVIFGDASGATAARLLCVVGILRAFDSLYLPLLDGLGWAMRNLVVAVVATVVLLGLDIGMALAFPELGYVGTAIGRTIGYPIVILLHGYIVLHVLDLTARRYATALVRIVACGVVATIAGLLVRAALPAMAPGLRLAIVGGSALAVLFVALAAFAGLGPRTILRELRS